MLSFSVIIVHHRTPGLLVRCVDALQLCGGTLADITVLDVLPFAPFMPDLEFDDKLTPKVLQILVNRGFGAACNMGAQGARGQLLVFLNADTRLDPGALASVGRAFANQPLLGIAGFRLREENRNPAPSRFRFPQGPARIFGNLIRHPWPRRENAHAIVLPIDDGDGPGVLRADWVLGAAMVVRKDVFDSVGGFDEGFFLFFEDVDFCQRARRAGWEVGTVPDACAFHVHGASTSQYGTAEMQAIRYASQLRYFRKYHGVIGWVAAVLDRSCLRWRL